jgi:hypothetical protein
MQSDTGSSDSTATNLAAAAKAMKELATKLDIPVFGQMLGENGNILREFEIKKSQKEAQPKSQFNFFEGQIDLLSNPDAPGISI